VTTKAFRAALSALACLASAAIALPAAAQEDPKCLSPNPADWPAAARPYFMVAFDTSGSMTSTVATNNSCGYPNNRLGHGRCAVKNTMQAFAGEARLGLASFARTMTGCSATCFTGCTYANLPGDSPGGCSGGCGPEPTPGAINSSSRAGANILVPLAPDSQPTNATQILGWVDNNCTGSQELFASGCTPLNGILRDMYRYYSASWTRPGGTPTYTSPLTSTANGERACRSVNVILVTDGGETCDVAADAVDAAADLFAGFTKDGISWKVKTFVIDFGNVGATADQIAAAGGTTAAYTASDEVTLSQALAKIISGAIKPEVCDNGDNNCNGCTDEGYTHYCNQGQTCCAWVTDPERLACISSYTQSITPANPGGNLALLPCTTPADQADPLHWLCYDPKETCDNVDNNCSGVVDENTLTCGNPAHCPSMEICDATDNDCDGQTDEGAVCNNVCLVAPTPEICDGCDNDCDGIVDEGIVPIACGALSPMNCAGTATCTFSGQAVGQPGACLAGGGFGACSNSPQAEICDGIDNNCNGVIDDGIPPILCVPAGQPANLDYA
jgi:hypothetical protein